MSRPGSLLLLGQVIENPLDECRLFDAGDDPQKPGAKANLGIFYYNIGQFVKARK